MGALAGLLKAAGHRVTGSDAAFDPPMGPALERWGIETMIGPDPANLVPTPDMVVVGNVCRPTHAEARAAVDQGMNVRSFPGVMDELFLRDRPSFVVAGTHGKTTSSTLLAFLLSETGRDPGFLLGGIPKDFDAAFRLGDASAPFVIEGDEYDSAFFEKSPKFWRYQPNAVLLTSVEHDHIDIYPDEASYLAAFEGLIERIPEDGHLVAFAGDARLRALAEKARCNVHYYALDSDDCGPLHPMWSAALAPPSAGATPMDLHGGGTYLGRLMSPLSGKHNARNMLGVLALAAVTGSDLRSLMDAAPRFGGVKRRQDLLAVAGGVRVFDDFAHHPTAVRETLAGLRALHPSGRLVCVFEPRSATASRRLHQDAYEHAFDAADLAVIAPVGRPEIALAEQLDRKAICESMASRRKVALAPETLDAVEAAVLGYAQPGDAIVLMSNGRFGDLHDRLIAALTPVRGERAS